MTHPFLKWVGGKRQLLPELMEHVPDFKGSYFEPFVGGGALFFNLPGTFLATLSDTNTRLIRTYRAVRDDVEGVIETLKDLRYDEKSFYEIRSAWDIDECTDVTVAAWLIYMNKTCFNGLYRVNKKGQFNVPFGRYVNPKICGAENLRACSRRLRNVALYTADFEAAVSPANEGDFVYFDPPYLPVTATSFTAYTGNGFVFEDHERLAECARKLKARGVHVLLSNSSSSVVRVLYEGFEIIEVSARRAVNSDAAKRGAVKEVIIK